CINNCDGRLEEAKLRAEYCTANKTKLCCAYLEKCENFKKSFPKDIVEEILALPVPEDKINIDSESIPIKRQRSSTSTVSSINSISSNSM
ncbi:33301_t:CDS:2, partial [Racocetra persica]